MGVKRDEILQDAIDFWNSPTQVVVGKIPKAVFRRK